MLKLSLLFVLASLINTNAIAQVNAYNPAGVPTIKGANETSKAIALSSFGWRQAGYDGTRSNSTPVVVSILPLPGVAGPSPLPNFQVLISHLPGALARIGDDGTLYATDGSNIYGYFYISPLSSAACPDAAPGSSPCPGLVKWSPISVPGLRD